MLKKYKKYKKEYLTNYVPDKLFDDIALTTWIRQVREARDKDMLRPWHMELLKFADFNWRKDPDEEEWYHHFHNGVRQYFHLTGYTGFIAEDFKNPEYPDIEAAGPWLKKQRQKYWWQADKNLKSYSKKSQLLIRYGVPLTKLHGRSWAYAQQHPDQFLLQGMKALEKAPKKKIIPREILRMMQEDPFAKYKKQKYLDMLIDKGR